MVSIRGGLGIALGLGAAAGAGVALWGVLVEPRILQVQHIEAKVPKLPSVWEGQRLALLGDLQIGAPLANTDTVRRAIERIVKQPPAAVLLAGDYVYNAAADSDEVVGKLVQLLRPLELAGTTCVGVLGNHDFAPENTRDPERRRELANKVVAELERLGIRILRIEAAPLRPGEDSPPLYVVGIGERFAHEDDWRTAFHQVPEAAPRVVLAHDPPALALRSAYARPPLDPVR